MGFKRRRRRQENERDHLAELVNPLDELAAEMRMYLAECEHWIWNEYNPFKLKVIKGKRLATEHWLGRIATLKDE
jgi:hypothetical protein